MPRPNLSSLLLPDDRHQQARMKVWAVSASSGLGFILLFEYMAWLGMVERLSASLFQGCFVAQHVVIYAIFRSGANRRLKDPGMTLPQLEVATLFSVWCYAIAGPARGAVLVIMMINIVYGVFSLTPRQGRIYALASLGALAITMLVLVTLMRPLDYSPQMAMVHFLFAAVSTGAMATLSMRLSVLRTVLANQKKELQAALDRLKMVAAVDELTQTYNRRHMTELVAREIKQHVTTDTSLCVALLDLDNFKRINDSYGHQVGDQVLQRFARVAASVLRSNDLLCRWGGEEFLVMFPQTTSEQAECALDRLHERMRVESFAALSAEHAITFSAGLTTMLVSESIETATERADQAMYQAKETGKNRTVIVPPSAAMPQPERAEPAATA